MYMVLMNVWQNEWQQYVLCKQAIEGFQQSKIYKAWKT